uniref:DUF1618 domain-containing protein n=1 Tax=Setaria viridis TaxID=4556 RepID=A0A4V6DCA0_SETVI|nr:hypothetical protein SEVIR_1G005000v2 [Setaria viridis]
MAPARVVLDRSVFFRDHPLEAEPLGEEAPGVVGGNIAYLLAMETDLQVVDPPGVSCLTMVRPHPSDPIAQYGRHLDSGFVAAAHKSLVAIYAGAWYSGWYLVLDLASSSPRSFTIPGIAGIGTTVITPLHPGAFFLAELLLSLRRPSKGLSSAMLCLWNSHSSSWAWDYKTSDLPVQVCHEWEVHMSFPVQSRNLLCWVDLLHGLLLCDLDEVRSELHMSFVPLPPNSCEAFDQQRLPNPQDFRTMACVDGTIKFFAMDGFVEGTPISLVTYTLDLDGPSTSWTKDTVLRLDDLWADETYISMGLPRDLEQIEGYWVRNVQFLLSVDTRKTRVISATQQNLPRTLLSSRFRITFDAASQLSSKYHQVEHYVEHT